MTKFKVSLVALENHDVPKWVYNEMSKNKISFLVNECTTKSELTTNAFDADVVWLFGGSKILKKINLSLLKNCGAILRTGSGTDNLNVDEATRLGIIVANTPEAISHNVAEHTIGLLLAIVRKISVHDRKNREGIWSDRDELPNLHIHGNKIGLIGFGHISKLVMYKLKGFDLSFLVHDPYVNNQIITDTGAIPVTLNKLLRESDFVSLHCPLTKSTKNMINKEKISIMKKDSIIINTSRGEVINEDHLFSALKMGDIAGAGLDVLVDEPPRKNNKLIKLHNVIVTSHIAAHSDDFLYNFWKYSVDTIIDLSNKRWPKSCVNPNVKSRWGINYI